MAVGLGCLVAAACAKGEQIGDGDAVPDASLGGTSNSGGSVASSNGGATSTPADGGTTGGGTTSAGGSGATSGASSSGGQTASGGSSGSSGADAGEDGGSSGSGGAGGVPSTGGGGGGAGGAGGTGGTPGCGTGTKDCGSGCVAETPSVGCAGASCTPCPTVLNGKAVCITGECAIQCDARYTESSGSCVSVCADGKKTDAETDVDCGGTLCPACADGLACTVNADCTSGVCQGSKCQVPSCTDGLMNGTELGPDCGGSCGPCGLGYGCKDITGCSGGDRCVGSVCVAPLATSCTGARHACAVSDGGRVLCWGDDTDGELGYGQSVDYRLGPIYVKGLTDATTVSCSEGGSHTCAVRKTGEVVCWGLNGDGQVGDGSTTGRPSPTPVPGITTAVQVTTGDSFSCALLANGEVRCWGQGGSGRLGNGNGSSSKSPVSVVAGETGTGNLASAVFIASGEEHTCAVLDAAHGARLSCWGNGAQGRLGNASASNQNAPVYVHAVGGAGTCTAADTSGCLANAGMVAGGENVTLVIHQAGLVSSFGDNNVGESGNGQASNVPRRLTGLNGSGTLDDGSWVAMGQNHGCAVHAATGSAVCWGEDDNGRLGDNDGQNSNEAAPVAIVNAPGYREVSTGQTSSCGRLVSGGVRCWGKDDQGQVGDGTVLDQLEPIDVAGVRGVVRARAGFDHTCAVTAEGDLYCFGTNAFNQLGLGDTSERWAPRRIPAPTGVDDVALQQFGTCALLKTGTVQCWGYDHVGENGDGQINNPQNRAAPATVVGVANAVQIAAGQYHACALIDQAPAGGPTQVWCWGYNNVGQLGDGTVNNNPTPVRVLGLNGFGTLDDAVSIGAGWNHTCAVRATGEVACWGYNNVGQLGDNTVVNRPWPVTVKNTIGTGNLANMASGRRVIDGAAEFTCALAQNGASFCWGDGSNGELGQGAVGDSHLPVQVTPVSDFSSISAYSDVAGHVCGVRAAGELDCWGYSGTGQIGDATLTERHQPVRVHLGEAATAYGNPDLATPVVGAVVGQFHSLAVHQNGTLSAWGYGLNGRLGTGRTDQDSTPIPVCVNPVP